MTFYASLRKELLELVRTHRLLVMAVILIFFGLASPLIAKLTPEMMRLIPGGEDFVSLIPTPTINDAIAQHVKNLSLFGLLLAYLMTMGAVAQEKERGTAVLMLVKPLPRGTFLLAKFVALALASLGCLTLSGLGGYYYAMLLFSAPDLSAWVVLNLMLWLYMLVYVALTLLASAIAKSQAAAAGLGIGAIVVLGALPSIPGLGKYLPGQLVTWGTALFADPSARSWPALGVSLCLIAACLVAAWIILDRQEI
ncbi:MAG: ABC transporter permease subunit [Anaerolineae bacterium]|nr:ABC transporter permease subunit [Anaerolineae bacterium]